MEGGFKRSSQASIREELRWEREEEELGPVVGAACLRRTDRALNMRRRLAVAPRRTYVAEAVAQRRRPGRRKAIVGPNRGLPACPALHIVRPDGL